MANSQKLFRNPSKADVLQDIAVQFQNPLRGRSDNGSRLLQLWSSTRPTEIPGSWHDPKNWINLVDVAKFASRQVLEHALHFQGIDKNSDNQSFEPPACLAILAVGRQAWMATSIKGPARGMFFHEAVREVISQLENVCTNTSDNVDNILIYLMV